MGKVSLARARQRERTRRALLNAAIQAVSSWGYERATIDLVAQAAGYSKGAFYVHFDSKERIFLELLKEAAACLVRVKPADRSSVVDSLAGLVRDHPYWAPLASEFTAHAWRNERVRHGLDELWEHCIEQVAAGLVEAGRAPSDVRAQAETIVEVFRGVALQSGADERTVRSSLERIVTLQTAVAGAGRRSAA
jgi:AcrR family transcriptional regulator